MTALVIAEHQQGKLACSTLSAITAAAQLTAEIKVLVAGQGLQTIIDKLQSLSGISEILVAEHECYQYPLAETWAPLIAHLAEKMQYILAPATTFGKNILPRAAALLNTTQISDISAVIDGNTFQRPIYAGNAIETVRSQESIKLVTIRPTAFEPAVCNSEAVAPLNRVNFTVNQSLSRFVRLEQQTANRPDLSSADIVIAGGRGLGGKKNFDRLAAIADRMGAALGASRAAVDAGLAPNDWQVGQTGKIVAPKLYIAVGISGAIQHLAGMKDSKTIVAINKDPEAPIFQIADYSLVADIEEVLNEWEQLLK